jgi:galactose mutarotase-like enzyme
MLAPVEGTPQDFTRSRQIGSTQLDTAFGSLVRRDDGRAVAQLHDPDSGRSLSQLERRRAAVAIEPMTCPPDAFRTGAGETRPVRRYGEGHNDLRRNNTTDMIRLNRVGVGARTANGLPTGR